MKNLITFLALSALVVGLTSCDKDSRCIAGKGDRVSKEYAVSEFQHLRINGSENVEVRKGESYHVRIEAQENIHERLELEVAGGELEIDLMNCVTSHKEIRVYITTPVLSDIDVSGSGDVVVYDTFEGGNVRLSVSGSGSIAHKLNVTGLDVHISGSGEISAAGSADQQSVRISGSGDYFAFPLQSRICDIKVSGSGNAEVSVSEHMNVEISGSGDVYYRGNPTMNLDISGSGDVEKD